MEYARCDLAVGTVTVLFYSANRFNTPSTNRSSTTAERYFLAVSLYCLSAVGAYAALLYSPHLIAFLASGNEDELPPIAQQLSSPLVVALLMTVLLPKLPLLSAADQWIRKRLQDMAAIPQEVRRFSATLRKQSLVVSEEVRAAIREKLRDEDFDEKDVRFDLGPGPNRLWTLLTTLFTGLEQWEADRRMQAYLQETGDGLEELRKRYRALAPKAKTCFKLLRESAAVADAGKARDAAELCAEDFSEQATKLHDDVLDFVSRGVLRTEFSDAARSHRLEALGFTVTIAAQPLTLNHVLSLFGVVGVLMVASSELLSYGGPRMSGVLLVRMAMIAAFYSVAVACAVLPKQRWAFAKREPGQLRPVAFYFAAGAMALVITQVVSFAFNCVLERSLELGKQRFLLSYPWGLVTFTVAVVTAVLIDDVPDARCPRWLWRVLEGLVAAAAVTVAAYVAHGWLQELASASRQAVAGYHPQPLAFKLCRSGAVGFVIGYLVPTWYRNPLRRVDSPDVTRGSSRSGADAPGRSPTEPAMAASR